MASQQPRGGGAMHTYASSSENLTSMMEVKRDHTAAKARKKKLLWLGLAILAVLIAIGVTLGVLASKGVLSGSSSATSSSAEDSGNASPSGTAVSGSDSDGDADAVESVAATASATTKSRTATSTASSTSSTPTETECPSKDDIPKDARGTFTDTSSWLELTDFNCTYTDVTFGDLPITGLNATWDDSARANPNVPALDKPWGSYSERPFRGVNVGGWLSLEPFITPSLFKYPASAAINAEYDLAKHLGDKAAAVFEKHYATFITEKDFKQIAEAGLDHVRIPFSYWAVETFEGDPYVPRISWRYLLRGIEWARKYGLRVKLDLHGLPGSQNGWNHSGSIGKINFIDGPDGAANAKRALEIHDRLSKFFAQDRYKNIVAFYGLANEPALALDQVKLEQWHREAIDIVVKNKVHGVPVFSEGMQGLSHWEGKYPEYKADGLVVDVHQYTIFDPYLLSLKPADRIEFGCKNLAEQSSRSMANFGPTMVGEWSQAHNDCTEHLNGVNNGARWLGTFPGVPEPSCPSQNDQCSCEYSNDESQYSDSYKLFIKTWAIAQMDAFEKGSGWFYWTWKTENAPLWSYKHGLDGGFMPKKAYEREWSCAQPIPDLSDVPIYI
ncbi:glycoside hydrolase superfamily [Plectosphaerella cucumerina]|uniref:glucan 1,3-beta-glucosidase n=1 Tax=Plectosphaerella cucumerina TaxID=40658 RepID=A0A8K0X9Z1_9PEZI|nr:glycoside hydrolase superfamily [Plectosphaerella cucumerina]